MDPQDQQEPKAAPSYLVSLVEQHLARELGGPRETIHDVAATFVANSCYRYVLIRSPHGDSILCLQCGRPSVHPLDIAHRYCAECHVFHPDEMGWEFQSEIPRSHPLRRR